MSSWASALIDCDNWYQYIMAFRSVNPSPWLQKRFCREAASTWSMSEAAEGSSTTDCPVASAIQRPVRLFLEQSPMLRCVRC